MMSVPNTPPAELRTLVDVFIASCAVAGSWDAPAFPMKSMVIGHHTIVFVVVPPDQAATTFLVILFLSDPMMPIRSHHAPLRSSAVHAVLLVPLTVPLDTALMSINPNERVSQTIAGTKQSPTNSLSVNVSLSLHIMPAPATNWNVKSGENIAYTQSFIALTRSIATRARVRSQNTRNINTPTSP